MYIFIYGNAKCALCAHYKVSNFAHSAKFARVKANLNQSQNKYCLRNNLSITSTPKSIPCKQPPSTVAGPLVPNVRDILTERVITIIQVTLKNHAYITAKYRTTQMKTEYNWMCSFKTDILSRQCKYYGTAALYSAFAQIYFKKNLTSYVLSVSINNCKAYHFKLKTLFLCVYFCLCK